MDERNISNFGMATDRLAKILESTVGLVINTTKTILEEKVEGYLEKERTKRKYEIEKIDLVERAKMRLFETEIRRQFNLEVIVADALKILPDNAKPEELDRDWLHHFASCAQDISADDLRKLWSTILATEATKGGQFSRRTLEALKTFTTQDCKTFELLSEFAFTIDNLSFIIVPVGNNWNTFYDTFGFGFDDYQHMAFIGILSYRTDTVYIVPANIDLPVIYQGKHLTLGNSGDQPSPVSKALFFSPIGTELLKIVLGKFNTKYLEEVNNHLNCNRLYIKID